MPYDMPLGWIHELSRQQADELAGQLGLSTEGTLEELRKRIKDKWTAVEPFLPSHTTAKLRAPKQPDHSSDVSPCQEGSNFVTTKCKIGHRFN
jgi:hypothetical protein